MHFGPTPQMQIQADAEHNYLHSSTTQHCSVPRDDFSKGGSEVWHVPQTKLKGCMPIYCESRNPPLFIGLDESWPAVIRTPLPVAFCHLLLEASRSLPNIPVASLSPHSDLDIRAPTWPGELASDSFAACVRVGKKLYLTGR